MENNALDLLNAKIAELTAQLEQLKKGNEVKKNQKEGKAGSSKYTRLSVTLANWGKIPQQQADLAKILSNNMALGQEYTEAEVFGFLQEERLKYSSLATSKQDVTYLFRYYRGLSNKDGKHAGFISRNFLRMS